jgi:hypothetical protein
MTKSTCYFPTPIVYKSKGFEKSKLNVSLGKKEYFSQSSNGANSHAAEHSGFLDGGSSNGGNSHGDEQSGFLGGGGSNGGNFHGGKHSGFLGGGNPNGGQPVGNLIINGTACNDTLRGNNYGSDTLLGTTEVARGVGEHDILIGGNARDTFVLGDIKGSFYLGQGSIDYAEIHNFGRCKDSIQLAGSAQDYSISYTNGISSIYRKDSCGGIDLVAQVDSACSPLDLNGSYFKYVAPACGGNILMG